MTVRVPRLALAALLVGLAFHNLAMALLWQAGVRGLALDVVAAWKEALLLVALVAALAASGAGSFLVRRMDAAREPERGTSYPDPPPGPCTASPYLPTAPAPSRS